MPLKPGAYSVTASLPGFRTQTQRVELTGESIESLTFALELAPLVTILWVVPEAPVSAADVIAHIRIVESDPSGPCGGFVATSHTVEVLEPLKGDVPNRISIMQEGAGVCFDGDSRVEGFEALYGRGDELVVFLRYGATAFDRVAGPALTFKVLSGQVLTRGFAGLEEEVTIAAFRQALKRLP